MSTDEPAAMGAHQCTRHAVPIRGSEVAPAASRRLALRTIVALRMRVCVCVRALAWLQAVPQFSEPKALGCFLPGA